MSDDLERIRTRVISDLRMNVSSSSSLARLVAARVVFGDHPYGLPLSGTVESVETIALADIRRLLAQRFFPRGSTLIIVGDLSAEEGFAFAEDAFSGWTATHQSTPAAAPILQPSPPRTVIVDLPDSGRSAVIVGTLAIARNDERYLAATVLNGLLTGYSGRLNREIRVKRGLSYGAGAGLHARRLGGSIMASTLVEHGRVGETIDVIRAVFAETAAAPPAAEDLLTRKAMLRGAFGRTLETVGGLAGAIGGRVMYDLPISELDTYLARLDALTAADVLAVAREILGTAPPSIIVVGDRSVVRPQLDGNVEEFRVAELELRSAGLRRQEP